VEVQSLRTEVSESKQGMAMERQYFSALPFLIATILNTVVGLSMIWPLLWVRRKLE
jgi:hypothetical protein